MLQTNKGVEAPENPAKLNIKENPDLLVGLALY